MARRVIASAAATLAFAASVAEAHPGHGAEAVNVRASGFAPREAHIGERESIIWFLHDSQTHSVTANNGQFDYTLKPGGKIRVSRRFNAAGTFHYHCKYHLLEWGTVTVSPMPAGIAPRLTHLKVKSGRKPKARFKLSKRATVVGRIERRQGGRWRVAKSFVAAAKRGLNRKRLPVRGLAPRRYRLSVVAYDSNDRRSKQIRARFRLR